MKINETFAPAKKGTAKIAIQISDLVVQRVRARGKLLKTLTSRMVCSQGRFIISSAEVIVDVQVIQVISLVDLLESDKICYFIIQCQVRVNLPLQRLALPLCLPPPSIAVHFPCLVCHTVGRR